jgi:hypothetical protein
MPGTATEGTNEPRQPDENASQACVRSWLERNARSHPGMHSHGWLRRLPARCLYCHNRASLLRGAAHVLVWQSMELSGRWSLESLRQGATGALPTSHARSSCATHLRTTPRASRPWAFRWQTRRETLNEDLLCGRSIRGHLSSRSLIGSTPSTDSRSLVGARQVGHERPTITLGLVDLDSLDHRKNQLPRGFRR